MFLFFIIIDDSQGLDSSLKYCVPGFQLGKTPPLLCYRRFMGLNVRDCLKECMLRQGRCHYIVYNRLYRICSLCEIARDGLLTTDPLKGDVTIGMKELNPALKKETGACANITCPAPTFQSCDIVSGVCKYSECDIPPRVLGAITPDIIHSDIGAKLRYVCLGNNNAIIECQKNATWTNLQCPCGINIALKRSANQSSTFEGNFASNAVDGNSDSHVEHGYCSHTAYNDASPWWMVDLGRNHLIRRVVIYNRDKLGYRLHDLNVIVVDENGKMQLCTHFRGPAENNEIIILDCKVSIEGRYVKLQIVSGDHNFLTLCEVEIYAL